MSIFWRLERNVCLFSLGGLRDQHGAWHSLHKTLVWSRLLSMQCLGKPRFPGYLEVL